MRNDGLRLFRALVRSEMAEHAEHLELLPRGCTVTVSRDCGAGGEEIARELAGVLGVRCLDRELLDAIVAEAHADHDAMARLDERVTHLMDDWLTELVDPFGTGRDAYRRHLVHVLLALSESGGVIVGRGAHLVLSGRRAFRLRVVGSPRVCAQRMADQEGLSLADARSKIERINAERAAFLRLHFHGLGQDEPWRWDLLLNTDRIEPHKAVPVILEAMRTAGFHVPAPAMELAGGVAGV